MPRSQHASQSVTRAGFLEWFLLAVIAFGLLDIWANLEPDFGLPAAIFRIVRGVKGGR